MNKTNSPAFQFYPKDYFGSMRVAVLTLEEEGAYNRALYYCWLHEFLPSNPNQLALIIGKNCTKEIAEKISAFFENDGEKLTHSRLEIERKKQKKFHKRQKANGSKGGRPQKEKPKDNPQITHGFILGNPSQSQKKLSSFQFPVSSFQSSNACVLDAKVVQLQSNSNAIASQTSTPQKSLAEIQKQVHKKQDEEYVAELKELCSEEFIARTCIALHFDETALTTYSKEWIKRKELTGSINPKYPKSAYLDFMIKDYEKFLSEKKSIVGAVTYKNNTLKVRG